MTPNASETMPPPCGADEFEVAILADGELPEGEARRIFFAAPALVACDGAVLSARALGREPDYVVGDGDSTADDVRAGLGERFVLVGEQDTNDLAKAFSFVRRRYPDRRKVAIVGAGGGREDHLLDNVFRLAAFAAELPEAALFTNHGRFDAVRGTRSFASAPGDAVSVFAADRTARAASDGLEWPLAGVDLSRLYSGAHNRAISTRFTLRSNGALLVYRPFPARP